MKSRYEFKFPDVGEGIHEGTIVKWLVKEGQIVDSDQVLGEIETDKAVVEMPSPKAGKVLKLHVKEGGTIKVGETMVTIEVEGEAPQTQSIEAKEERTGAEKAGGVVGFIPESSESLYKKVEKAEKPAESRGLVLATPAVRKLAADLGVDITKVKGTGPEDRVLQDDVVNAAKGGKAPASKQAAQPSQSLSQPRVVKKYDIWGYVDRIPLKGIRKTIANHMEEAWQIPTVAHMDEADVTKLSELREKEKVKAKTKGIHLTFLPYIVKAVIAALQKHPLLNATLDKENGEIIVKKYYNLGIAVDTGDGLIVPVVKGADKKDLYTIAAEIEKFAELAKTRKIDLADLQGGTLTITNIGVLGGKFFTPIINSPESAILGTGKIEDKAVVIDGKIAVRKILPLVISFDHRVLDGAEAARFMNDLIAVLQEPEKIK